MVLVLIAAWYCRAAAGGTADSDSQQFRDQVLQYLRQIAAHSMHGTTAPAGAELDRRWSRGYQTIDWSVHVTAYRAGSAIGHGDAHDRGLAATLRAAAAAALPDTTVSSASDTDPAPIRFKVSFDYFPARTFAFIDYQGRGLELLGNRVAVRRIDTAMLQRQLQASQGYLLRVLHPELHGFYKFYNAGEDKHETRLRTIYTASGLYTLLKLYQFSHDPQLESNFRPIADFILANQIRTGPNAGGFYYSLNPKTGQHDCLVVVGTASKSIFTLLELDRFYKTVPRYLQAARQAGAWLLGMIKDDGRVRSSASCAKGGWHYQQKQSFLYSGQVLSALSRLTAVTGEQRYRAGAERIARRFTAEIGRQGLLLGDDYRPPNSISTSWALMSLIDYARINNGPEFRELIARLGGLLLARQIDDAGDAYNAGRYQDAMTASGNGWINEVMGNLYDFCVNEHLADCQAYRGAMLQTSRWLLQNAYSEANGYEIKNPVKATGGFIHNFRMRYVRTDAVCHGVNSLISMLRIAGPGEELSLELPERPLAEILPLLRAGNGFPAL